MFLVGCFKFRSIISVASLSPHRPDLCSISRRFRSTSNHYRPVPSAQKLPGLIRTVRKGRYALCIFTRLQDSSKLNLDLSGMDSPKDVSELTEDIDRLSASLAELSHGSEGLAKVSVDKLESQHFIGHDETVDQQDDFEGMLLGTVKGGKVGKDVDRHEDCSSEKPAFKKLEGVIQLASKGPAEAKYVEDLQSGAELQLPDGYVLTASTEVTNVDVKKGFDVNLYLKKLLTSQFGRLVLYSPVIPSTHTLLSQNFHAFPTGTICIAGTQLQGKGRSGNSWNSPHGCLMFSFTIQMTNGRAVPFLQYVVSLAVIQAVEKYCKISGFPIPDLKIKWPNDLYANRLKIGGVLCTSSYRAKTFNIVVGVGLNVGNREPTTCLDALVEELGGQSVSIKLEELLAQIMARFEALNSIFQNEGFTPLQDLYYNKWLHTGQNVVIEKEHGNSSVSPVAVTIQGLTPTGYLLATDGEGVHYELHPDGNSFDFLKGLVRQKVSN